MGFRSPDPAQGRVPALGTVALAASWIKPVNDLKGKEQKDNGKC